MAFRTISAQSRSGGDDSSTSGVPAVLTGNLDFQALALSVAGMDGASKYSETDVSQLSDLDKA